MVLKKNLVGGFNPICKICSRQNGFHFPRDQGGNKTYLSCHHLRKTCFLMPWNVISHPFYTEHTFLASLRGWKPWNHLRLFRYFLCVGFCCDEMPSYQGNILSINSKFQIYLDVAIFQKQ